VNESAVAIEVQVAEDIVGDLLNDLPTIVMIEQWLTLAFTHLKTLADEQPITGSAIFEKELIPEVNIRIVSVDESQALNAQYRQKDKPTNVLSFESDLPDFIPSGFIGDLVICAEVVKNEALQQNKALLNHWAHMCVHGALHLLGYDHVADSAAAQMETIEVEILVKLGIDDPYQLS
jgi:probable rRNA maturation factor